VPAFAFVREQGFVLALFLLALGWLILFGSYGWTTVPRYCAEHFDFGIYVQAIARFSWHELNPWLSARGVHIFNDHFDPILFGALFFRPFFSPPIAGLLAEQTFVLGSVLPIAWLWKRKDIGGREAFAVCSLLLLSAGTVDAVLFPIHPTTWTLFPATLLAAAWLRRSDLGTLIGLVLLFACKEEHVFCGPFLALGLWALGRTRAAWGALILTGLWAAFAFLLRPVLLGPTIPYFQGTLAAFWRDPRAALLESVRAPEIRRLGTLLVPFAPLIVWAIRQRKAPSWALLSASLPIFASRFVAIKWGYQYGPPLVGLWVAAFVPLLASTRIPFWVAAGTLILLLTSLEMNLRGAIDRLRPSGPSVCSKEPMRLNALKRGIAYLQEHPKDAAIVTSTLVAPLADRPEIYAVGSSERLSRYPYRYLLVEKPPYGYDWPLSSEEVSKKLDDWLGRKDTQVIFENQYAVLAEGNF